MDTEVCFMDTEVCFTLFVLCFMDSLVCFTLFVLCFMDSLVCFMDTESHKTLSESSDMYPQPYTTHPQQNIILTNVYYFKQIKGDWDIKNKKKRYHFLIISFLIKHFVKSFSDLIKCQHEYSLLSLF